MGLKIQTQNFPNSTEAMNSVKEIIKEFNLNQMSDNKTKNDIILIDGKTSNEDMKHKAYRKMTFGIWSNFTGGQLIIRKGKENYETEFMPLTWVKKYSQNDSNNIGSSKLNNWNRVGIIWPDEINSKAVDKINSIKRLNNSQASNLNQIKIPIVASTNTNKELTSQLSKINHGLLNKQLNNVNFSPFKIIKTIEEIFPKKNDTSTTIENNADTLTTEMPFGLEISFKNLDFNDQENYTKIKHFLTNEKHGVEKTENSETLIQTKESNNKFNFESKENTTDAKRTRGFDSKEIGLEISFHKKSLLENLEKNLANNKTTTKNFQVIPEKTDPKQMATNDNDELVSSTKITESGLEITFIGINKSLLQTSTSTSNVTKTSIILTKATENTGDSFPYPNITTIKTEIINKNLKNKNLTSTDFNDTSFTTTQSFDKTTEKSAKLLATTSNLNKILETTITEVQTTSTIIEKKIENINKTLKKEITNSIAENSLNHTLPIISLNTVTLTTLKQLNTTEKTSLGDVKLTTFLNTNFPFNVTTISIKPTPTFSSTLVSHTAKPQNKNPTTIYFKNISFLNINETLINNLTTVSSNFISELNKLNHNTSNNILTSSLNNKLQISIKKPTATIKVNKNNLSNEVLTISSNVNTTITPKEVTNSVTNGSTQTLTIKNFVINSTIVSTIKKNNLNNTLTTTISSTSIKIPSILSTSTSKNIDLEQFSTLTSKAINISNSMSKLKKKSDLKPTSNIPTFITTSTPSNLQFNFSTSSSLSDKLINNIEATSISKHSLSTLNKNNSLISKSIKAKNITSKNETLKEPLVKVSFITTSTTSYISINATENNIFKSLTASNTGKTFVKGINIIKNAVQYAIALLRSYK